MMALYVFSFSTFCAPLKDLGVQGHTWPIAERSLLQVIQEKLRHAEKSGKLKELQQQFVSRAKKSLSSPKSYISLPRAQAPREYFFDPSYTQKEEIKDHKGRIIVAQGRTINPLDHVSWGEPILLIDGRDPAQVAWALRQVAKIVLVAGKPMDLSQEHKRWFYFDQGGVIARKFGLEQVPATISQEGSKLKIKEIVL